MTLNKFDYSTEMIFSSSFYNCSPKGYGLLRDSKNIILPSYLTFKRLTLLTYMNPLIEQHDKNFLMCIKINSNYKCSRTPQYLYLLMKFTKNLIIRARDNSNEVAASAFVFMVSSVYSQYKDVVHVMPTKCLKPENLFDIVKCIIIGLEEIWLIILKSLTDNNAINKKKLYLFFVVPLSLPLYIPIQLWSLNLFSFYCYILILDRTVNQRSTCVNKWKKKWKQVGVMKEYRQVLVAVELVGHRKARVRANLQTEGCGHQQHKPRCRRSAKWVLEDNTACHGKEKKLGQYSSLSLSPLISHTWQKRQPSWE